LVSLLGLCTVALIGFTPGTMPPWVAAPVAGRITAPTLNATHPTAAQVATTAQRATTVASDATTHPITHLSLDRSGLDADVVPAHLVDRDGATTWDVPAFKVGHAESTAGAGEEGNAVLLGHVTSLHSGNVFQDLDQAQPGDRVQVFSDGARFDYIVTNVDRVPRTDLEVVDQGSKRAISLITCAGIWLPTIWDYTERLVVRAE